MRKITYTFTSLIWIFLIFLSFVSAQESQSADWLRVRSDDGEFSVEVPVNYDFYVDKDGFLVSDNSKSYRLSKMKMLNVYHEKTLLSFEVYETNRSKTVAEILADREDKYGKKSEIKLGELKYKQVLIKKENLYAVRRYLFSKDYLYVLTAASRNGETPALKRFLDSASLKAPAANSAQNQTVDTKTTFIPFASLKTSKLEIDPNPEPVKKSGDKNSPLSTPVKSENSLPLVLIAKPSPSFTNAARQSNETGEIRMRVTFSENGSVTKIGFLSTLKDGLIRETVFAAIRVKYLPAEKDGEAVAVTKLIYYAFSIY
ncbi:hypothetical protein BH24ACI1_BH24ACI1_03920 [soil metagenome]